MKGDSKKNIFKSEFTKDELFLAEEMFKKYKGIADSVGWNVKGETFYSWNYVNQKVMLDLIRNLLQTLEVNQNIIQNYVDLDGLADFYSWNDSFNQYYVEGFCPDCDRTTQGEVTKNSGVRHYTCGNCGGCFDVDKLEDDINYIS